MASYLCSKKIQSKQKIYVSVNIGKIDAKSTQNYQKTPLWRIIDKIDIFSKKLSTKNFIYPTTKKISKTQFFWMIGLYRRLEKL